MNHRYRLDDQVIAKEMKAARKAAHLTQEQLAEKVNLSLNAISKLETAMMPISLQTLVAIANALNLDINRLLSSHKDIDSKDENTNILFESLVANLTTRDKAFLIRVIKELKAYNAAKGDSEQTDSKSQLPQETGYNAQ